ncbi:MAG: hypothetical protein H0T62_07450 [Parachlamydiaceae bacterium]|nr:hypothetical protein [Parachlamydiaceae bacterium]
MVPISHSNNYSVLNILDFPRDIRFSLLDMLGSEKSAFETTCSFFWKERLVRLITNSDDLGKFLSWLIHQNKSEQIKDLGNTDVPIKLEVPLHIGKREKCLRKIIKKFPYINSISISQKYDGHKFRQNTFSQLFGKTDLDDLCAGLNTLKLDSYLPAKAMREFSFPANIKKLVFMDLDLKKARYNKGDSFEQLSSDKRSLFHSAGFDLNLLFRQCTQLEELDIAGRCLHSWFFKNEGRLPSTLYHLSLTGTQILVENLNLIVKQCPELRSLDIMWNEGMWDNYAYSEIQRLKHLEKFTISRSPTDKLLHTLSKCTLQSVVIEYTALTTKWVSDMATPLLTKLREITIDHRDQDLVIVKQLQKKYPHLEFIIHK